MNLRTGERVEPGAAAEANRGLLAEEERRVTEEVETAAEQALASRGQMPSPASAADGVYGQWPDSSPPDRAPFST